MLLPHAVNTTAKMLTVNTQFLRNLVGTLKTVLFLKIPCHEFISAQFLSDAVNHGSRLMRAHGQCRCKAFETVRLHNTECLLQPKSIANLAAFPAFRFFFQSHRHPQPVIKLVFTRKYWKTD